MEYAPQLPTLVDAAPTGEGWLHEVKYDGYRIGAAVQHGRARLWSRRGNDWTAALPELAAALLRLGHDDLLLDGELAALRPDGRTSFQLLQNAFGGGPRPTLSYFAFDVLELDGDDLRALPLEDRKAILEDLLATAPPSLIHYSAHVLGSGPEVFGAACRAGAEGIVSKRRDGAYEGRRSKAWLKVKCFRRQEFVIGGVLDRRNSHGLEVGALLIGTYEAGRLRYAGKVGTGYTQAVGRDLRARLRELEQDATPFDPAPPRSVTRGAHWVRPDLVCEVAYTEMTEGGVVRHPSFVGLRLDKPAREVVVERPAELPAAARSKPDEVAGLRISHPERLLFPAIGTTKLDLARYYEAVATWMLPHVQGRPLTLLRCDPDVGHCSFLRHAKAWGPSVLRRVSIRERHKLGEYLVVENPEGLVALAQMGIVEVHTWNVLAEEVELADRMVLDLDPGPAVSFGQVIDAARRVRGILSTLGLRSWVKTTGGVGLHVVVPLHPAQPWATVLRFARRTAEVLSVHDPDRFTTAIARRGREHLVLLDYLRNNRTNTSVAAYSCRARPNAPVSAPLDWAELDAIPSADHFTLATILPRLRERGEVWTGYAEARQTVEPQALEALSAVSRPQRADARRRPKSRTH